MYCHSCVSSEGWVQDPQGHQRPRMLESVLQNGAVCSYSLRRIHRGVLSSPLDCSCVCAKALQSCLTLCVPVDGNPPGSSVRGILQARILEWVTVASSRESSQPRDPTCVSCDRCVAGRLFTTEPPRKHFLLIPNAIKAVK